MEECTSISWLSSPIKFDIVRIKNFCQIDVKYVILVLICSSLNNNEGENYFIFIWHVVMFFFLSEVPIQDFCPLKIMLSLLIFWNSSHILDNSPLSVVYVFNTFSQDIVYLFIFLMLLCWTEILHVNVVELNQSFSFMTYACLCLDSEILSSSKLLNIFSCRSFIILLSLCKPLIHLVFIFVFVWGRGLITCYSIWITYCIGPSFLTSLQFQLCLIISKDGHNQFLPSLYACHSIHQEAGSISCPPPCLPLNLDC